MTDRRQTADALPSPIDAGRTLRPLRNPRSLTEDATELLRAAILFGTFRPGERLVEAKIAEQLNVSRGPVREAFKILRTEGLVDEEPRRGTFVTRPKSRDVQEIYELRGAIEGRAARTLTTAHRDPDTQELRVLIERMRAASRSGDVAAISSADLAFHETVCRLSGNSRLHEAFTRSVPALRALLRLDEHLYESMDEIADQHQMLLQAIELGNPTQAALRFEEHVEHASELITSYLDSLAPT